MLINTYLDTEDFVHLYYPEDEGSAGSQGCGAGARLASKYPPRPPSPEYSTQVSGSSSDMSDRDRYRAQPPPEPPPHRVRAADLYPRLRTHYDEPGLDVSFTPICGEFVQWVGRTADGGSIAMSNYRLHLQPRRRNGPGTSVPLRLIDALEIRDLLHLVVLCKHGRQLKAAFNNNDQCIEWWRRLSTALVPLPSIQETFAAAYAAWAKEQPPTSVHRALMKASHAQQRHWFGPEVERLGFTAKGAWRVSAANAEYKLCPSYPPLLVVPDSICDEDLDSVARFRAMRRIPAVVWRHRGTGAVIARSSQPEVGWLGWRSSEDELLLSAFVNACRLHQNNANAKQVKLLIVDARSYASAVTNRARGGGCECQQYYPAADIQFMSLPNIHHVRKSFQQMRALAAEPSDQPNWHSNVERTLWLQYVAGVARAGSVVARAVCGARPVLVHCSDGWDRTPQIAAAAQLQLDPHYRTRHGFRVLIEREWLDFGHKFADRCGHQFGPEDPNERSPIFLQWLDVVHQMMLQYPCSFEFNEAYLVKLATHVHSCMFGTFLGNSRRERAEYRVSDTTAHVWHLLEAPAYTNHLYAPTVTEQVLWPDYSVRSMQPWWSMFCGERAEYDEEPEPLPVANLNQNGMMTKTRSCDNLLNEGEKRTTQRRCSDPSLPPDVMKLSMVAVARRSLTDSCVDDLPTLPLSTPNNDQVEVDPEHFENSPPTSRDLASNCSSLERELAPHCNTEQVDLQVELQAELQVETSTTTTNSTSSDNIKSSVLENAIRSALGDTPEETTHNGGDIQLNGRLQNGQLNDQNEEAAEHGDFVCDTYTDVMGIKEATKETARTRNISITWRSISESSNQSFGGFDLPDGPPPAHAASPTGDSHESSPIDAITNHNSTPLDNHNSTEGDVANHNVTTMQLTNHNRPKINGAVNSVVHEVDMNGGATSSSVSSESEAEGARAKNGIRASRGSQLTLCPASPRRRHYCCHCTNGERRKNACATSACWCGVCNVLGDEKTSTVKCVCGGSSATLLDPLDGLPHIPDATQARLHQIILTQKNANTDVSRVASWNRLQKVVSELSGQLVRAREALRRAGTPPAPTPAPPPPACSRDQKCSRSSRSGSASDSASGSVSGSSGSEVEAGEEAAAWLPDRAATRCQHCSERFWLVRRRHHCRRCGGIFCGSCSSVHADAGGLRLCRTCRAKR